MPNAARTSSEYRPFPNEHGRNWRQEHVEIPLMLRTLRLPRAARVLEIGCGRGIALPTLARHLTPARLVGIDIDTSLLADARTRLDETATRAELIVADVRCLPFPDGYFDLIIDFGTCFHVARAEQALNEVARALTFAGIFATETRLSQMLSHPIRSRGRRLPWPAAQTLAPRRRAGLWQSHWRCR
jgi:ubiquinone/menaquinone biosynthesis C-methylase UbiE